MHWPLDREMSAAMPDLSGERMRLVVLLLAFSSAVLAGCAYIAESTAPKRQATSSRSDAAVKADALFWQTFHAGRYEEIPTVLQALTAANLSDPNDARSEEHTSELQSLRHL